ncbi:MAG: GFA family protein [Pseudomonadota bacterium]
MTSLTISGGCLCGAISYVAEPETSLPYICHCTDCQRYGGSPFHAAIVVPASALDIKGDPRVYAVKADSGRQVARYFCGDCGGHLFTSPWPEATRYSIKAGTLNDPSIFEPAHEIWTKSGVSWLSIDASTEQFEEGFTRPIDIGS